MPQHIASRRFTPSSAIHWSTSLMALEGLKALRSGLTKVVADYIDPVGRTSLLFGSFLAGSALGSVGMAIHHKICHVLGGTFGLSHGDANAVILLTPSRPTQGPSPRSWRQLPESSAWPSRRRPFRHGRRRRSAVELVPTRDGRDRSRPGCQHCDGEPGYNPRPVDHAWIRQLLMMLSWGSSRWPGLTPRGSRDVRDLNETNVTAVLGQMHAVGPTSADGCWKAWSRPSLVYPRSRAHQGEWLAAVRFLTAVGHRLRRQASGIHLLSDVLGLSILVDAINHRRLSGGTESTVTGPFWVSGAPELKHGATIARGNEAVSGEITVVHGRVIDEGGRPVAGAILDVWQASPAGMYDVQDPDQPEMNLRGIFRSGNGGG